MKLTLVTVASFEEPQKLDFTVQSERRHVRKLTVYRSFANYSLHARGALGNEEQPPWFWTNNSAGNLWSPEQGQL